jgi:CheY-like chemotaxis protein
MKTMQTFKQILVVDDDASLRDALRKILEKAGYAVTVAGDVDAALGCLAIRRFDLILTDYRMPGKNGLALAQAVMEDPRGERPAIILMTAYHDQLGQQALQALQAVQEYIDKPIGRAELLIVVHNVLQAQRGDDGLADGALPAAAADTMAQKRLTG